jgi:hypothetical protein
MILTACGSQQSVVQEAATVPIISTQIFMNNPRCTVLYATPRRRKRPFYPSCKRLTHLVSGFFSGR